jgi:hypothetical protein
MSFLIGNARPTGLLNEITTKAQLSPSTPACFLRIDDNHKKKISNHLVNFTPQATKNRSSVQYKSWHHGVFLRW